jgi:hypothetical protein
MIRAEHRLYVLGVIDERLPARSLVRRLIASSATSSPSRTSF